MREARDSSGKSASRGAPQSTEVQARGRSRFARGNILTQYEGELEHTISGFLSLKERIESLVKKDGKVPDIVFEATGVYSKGLEDFLQAHHYPYIRLNPLEAKLQMAAIRRHKTDISDAHELAKSHFRSNRQETYVQDNYFEQMPALGFPSARVIPRNWRIHSR